MNFQKKHLTQENFSYKKEEKETECTAAVSEYGLTETDFHQDTEYQIEDFCTITAERDLVNGDILELTMTCQKGKRIEPGELASKLLLFLADAEDPDNKTAGDLIAKDRELQKNTSFFRKAHIRQSRRSNGKENYRICLYHRPQQVNAWERKRNHRPL